MSRSVTTGLEVVDQLPAWEPGSMVKRSGLTLAGGDFTISTWRDGAPEVLVVDLAEIGSSGEYRIAFTPAASGFVVVEVAILFNGETWVGEYDVARPVLLGVV